MPQKIDQLILASSSPRRAQLLETAGVNFVIAPSHFVERLYLDEQPTNYIMRVARAKAVEVARTRDSGLVLGADTIVVVDGKTLGKPADETEAREMLRMLSGRWHAVMTGVSLYDAGTRREVADYDKTLVRFAKLNEAEIDWYVGTGECNDKAGAYAIQEKGGLFVEEIAGNYHNVVGLPLSLLYRLVRQLGYSLI
jgi:septum formation protein